jgi:metal-sulfur cluster biosynthetic enzyme
MDRTTIEEVRQALSEIVDPETGLNIMRMDLIHDLSLDSQGRLSMTFRPSSPVCPMAYSLGNEIKKRLGRLETIKAIDIRIENFRDAERLEKLLRS